MTSRFLNLDQSRPLYARDFKTTGLLAMLAYSARDLEVNQGMNSADRIVKFTMDTDNESIMRLFQNAGISVTGFARDYEIIDRLYGSGGFGDNFDGSAEVLGV